MRINLEQARKRAKDRVRDGRAVTLAEAQLAVARELGYASWPKLVHALERPTAEQVVASALDVPDRSRALLERAPALRNDPWVALSLGDASRTADAGAPGGPLAAPPLFYVCRSRIADDTAAAARDLLARGAGTTGWWGGGWTCLSVACSRGDHELARVLLDAGAEPNDNDSLYHSTEAADDACTRLLLERGARPHGTNALAHALDFERLERVRQLLDHGADPNEGPEGTCLHHAVKRGRSNEFVRLLVERGADVGARDAEGRTAFAHAALRGGDDLARLLAELGSPTDVAERDVAVAALLRGERVDDPPPLDGTTRELLVDSALSGPALDAVIDAYGLDLRGGFGGGTLLHWTAWHGVRAGVERLLAAGADPHVRAETEFDTPLGWAAHGSRFAPPGDHVGAAEALVAAGARVEPRHVALAAPPLDDWLAERTLPA